MPPIQPAEVLLISRSDQKQKQKRPHNPKRFKASVMFVVDSVEHFDVTSRLGIIWDTCATSSVLSPAEVPHDATWLSRANSVMYGMGDGAATVQGEVELLVMSTYGGCRLKIKFLVCETPGIMHAIIADPDMVKLGALPDPAKNMVWLADLKERVHTDRLDKVIRVIRRLALPPIGIFSICVDWRPHSQ